MTKKSSVVARRAWNLLRLALIWAGKGGVLRNRVAVSLNIIHKLIARKLVHSNESRRALVYGDREFSFDDTPIIHVKMHRPSSSLRFRMPHIPCIKPQVDFDCDDYEEDGVMGREQGDELRRYEYIHVQSACILNEEEDEEEDDDVDCDEGIGACILNEEEDREEDDDVDCDEGIDVKAEKFIANFYEQMKLQR